MRLRSVKLLSNYALRARVGNERGQHRLRDSSVLCRNKADVAKGSLFRNANNLFMFLVLTATLTINSSKNLQSY